MKFTWDAWRNSWAACGQVNALWNWRCIFCCRRWLPHVERLCGTVGMTDNSQLVVQCANVAGLVVHALRHVANWRAACRASDCHSRVDSSQLNFDQRQQRVAIAPPALPPPVTCSAIDVRAVIDSASTPFVLLMLPCYACTICATQLGLLRACVCVCVCLCGCVRARLLVLLSWLKLGSCSLPPPATLGGDSVFTTVCLSVCLLAE